VLSDGRLVAADVFDFLADRVPIAALRDLKEKYTQQLRWYFRFEGIPAAIFPRKRKDSELGTLI
jgi:hypothetical protein